MYRPVFSNQEVQMQHDFDRSRQIVDMLLALVEATHDSGPVDALERFRGFLCEFASFDM